MTLLSTIIEDRQRRRVVERGLFLLSLGMFTLPVVVGLQSMEFFLNTSMSIYFFLVRAGIQLTFGVLLFHTSSKLVKIANSSATLVVQPSANIPEVNAGVTKMTVRDFMPAAGLTPAPSHGMRNYEGYQPCSPY